jgi:hypothetical protein
MSPNDAMRLATAAGRTLGAPSFVLVLHEADQIG